MTRFLSVLLVSIALVSFAHASDWCPLFAISGSGSIVVKWNFDAAKATVMAGERVGVVSPFVRRALVGDEVVPLSDYPRFLNGDLWVERSFLEKLGASGEVLRQCRADLPKAELGWGLAIRRIVIDPGHGGRDTGVQAKGLEPEKRLTLEFARLLKSRLEDFGFWVALTRDDDRYLSLSERVEIADEYGADLLISVHFNGWEDADVRGFEVFYPSKIPSNVHVGRVAERENLALGVGAGQVEDFIKVYWRFKKERDFQASELLANLIGRSAERGVSGLVTRGVWGAPFAVLVKSSVPAVLVEFGYITNPDEAELLLSSEYRSALIESVAQAVCACDIVLWLRQGGARWQGRTGEGPTN